MASQFPSNHMIALQELIFTNEWVFTRPVRSCSLEHHLGCANSHLLVRRHTQKIHGYSYSYQHFYAFAMESKGRKKGNKKKSLRFSIPLPNSFIHHQIGKRNHPKENPFQNPTTHTSPTTLILILTASSHASPSKNLLSS